MRLLLGIAMLLAASPAAARERGLPRWLVGTWCPETLAPTLQREDCNRWVAKGGGLSADLAFQPGGSPDVVIQARVELVRGRLRYTAEHRHYRRPAWRERYLEVSRGPGEMLFARETADGHETIRFVRAGDWLTVETVAPGNAMFRERYALRR